MLKFEAVPAGAGNTDGDLIPCGAAADQAEGDPTVNLAPRLGHLLAKLKKSPFSKRLHDGVANNQVIEHPNVDKRPTRSTRGAYFIGAEEVATRSILQRRYYRTTNPRPGSIKILASVPKHAALALECRER